MFVEKIFKYDPADAMPVDTGGSQKRNQTKFQEETMKKFWIILLALGLVAGFAMSASAADVKFSGSYYVLGAYIDNPSLKTTDRKTATDQQALAFYHQRLRIQTEFKIVEGLSLVTRFDALEKAWGHGGRAVAGWRGDAAYGSAGFDVTNRSSQGVLGARAQENIEWERAYIDFTTKIGRFNVGYQNFIAWGTMFLDTHVTIPGIKYFIPVGPFTFVAALEKRSEQNSGATTYTDADSNVYDIGVIYKFGAGDAGILYQYGDGRTNRPAAAAVGEYAIKMHIFDPYVKMKFGPVYVEAEGVYGFGQVRIWDNAMPSPITNVDAEALGLYLQVRGDFGPAYAGGVFAYMRGDDPKTTNKVEGGLAFQLVAGQAWNPCLIMWSDELYGAWHRTGHLTGYGTAPGAGAAIGTAGTSTSVFFDNAWLYQIYAGIKPVKQADIMLKLSYAYADKKPMIGGVEFVGDVYGTELDLIAKYKLFDNLEYMVGAAYLWTGNYWKGTSENNKIDNNYFLVHKLTLSF